MNLAYERVEDKAAVDFDVYEYAPGEDETHRTVKVEGIDGNFDVKHGIIMRTPTEFLGNTYGQYEITYINISKEEKEKLFSILDAELHDTTYKKLDDEVSTLRYKLEDAENELEYYREHERKVS